MNTNEERNYLRLQLFSIDLSTEVVRDYAKRNLLGKQSTFKTFLQVNQHDIYHIWSSGIECCKCYTSGPGNGKYGRFSKEQFAKLYDISGTITRGHIKRDKGGKVVQTCCCNIIDVKECSLDDIDISTVFPLLLTFGNPSAQINNWITEIKAVRNKLCHPSGTKDFDDINFNTLWGRLETAVCGIAINTQSSSWAINLLKTKINELKTEDPNTEKMKTLKDQLREDIEQIVTEQSSVQNTALLQSISEMCNQNTTQCMNTFISKLEEISLNFTYGKSVINMVGGTQDACGNDIEGNTFKFKLTVKANNMDYNAAVKKLHDAISTINEMKGYFNIEDAGTGSIIITTCLKEDTVSPSFDELKHYLQDFLKTIIRTIGLQYKKAEIEVTVLFPPRDRYQDVANCTRKRKLTHSKDESERPTKAKKSPSIQRPTKAKKSPSIQRPTKAKKSPSIQRPTKAKKSPSIQRPTKAKKSPSIQSYQEGNDADSFEKQIQELIQTHYENGADNIDIVSHILIQKEKNWDKLTSQEENETIAPTLQLVNAANNSFEYAIQMFAALEEPLELSLDQVRSKETKLSSELSLIKKQLEDERKSLSKSERSLNHACNILKATNTKLEEAKMQHQRHLDKKKKGVIGVRLPIVDFIKDKVSGINTSISHVQDQCVNLEQTAKEANTNVQNLEREHEAFQDKVISLTNTKTEVERRFEKEAKKIENLECIKEYLKKVDQILSNCSGKCHVLFKQMKSESKIKSLLKTVQQIEGDLRSFCKLEIFEKK